MNLSTIYRYVVYRMIPVMLLIIAALVLGTGAAFGEIFGYNTAGGTAGVINLEGNIGGSQYTLTEDAASLDSVTIYTANTIVAKLMRVAVVRASDSTIVDTSAEFSADANTAWRSVALLNGVSATAGDYQLVGWSAASTGSNTMFSDAGSAREMAKLLSYSNGWPSPVNWGSDPGTTNRSIYCTYTPVGGGATPARRRIEQQRLIRGWFIRESQKCFAGDEDGLSW